MPRAFGKSNPWAADNAARRTVPYGNYWLRCAVLSTPKCSRPHFVSSAARRGGNARFVLVPG